MNREEFQRLECGDRIRFDDGESIDHGKVNYVLSYGADISFRSGRGGFYRFEDMGEFRRE